MSEWISIDSKLPDMREIYKDGPLSSAYCLVFNGYRILSGKLEQSARRRFSRWVDQTGRVIDVTHWMPYPDPPKESK